MADKEPRRRKKRRDSQKKDDVRHTEEQFASMKSESRESDQEVEEETISHHHSTAPSSMAKIVFVILFSGLVVSLSFIFISLRDVDRGPIDIFDMDHGDHHGEALHDEHLEEIVHDDHHHDEKIEVTIDDFIPGLSSIFSLNNEVIKEVESPEISSEENKDNDVGSEDVEPESPVDQGILEEYIEDTPAISIEEPLVEEPLSTEIYSESTTSTPDVEEIYSTVDYADVTTSLPSDEAELITETLSSEKPEEMPSIHSSVNDPEEILPTESAVHILDDLSTTASLDHSDEEDSFPFYEKADITNEIDYDIRESLEELDDIVLKDSDNYIDDVDIGDENEDDHHIDDEEIDEGAEEEFDFWQF